MAVLRPCLESVSQWLTGCSGKPRPWRLAALGVALFACSFAAGEAPVESDGCVRCSAAPAVLAPRMRPQRSWRKEARRDTRAKHRLAMAIGWAGGSYAVCVRACDGSFFPVFYFGAANRSDTLEQVCRSLCPNALRFACAQGRFQLFIDAGFNRPPAPVPEALPRWCLVKSSLPRKSRRCAGGISLPPDAFPQAGR